MTSAGHTYRVSCTSSLIGPATQPRLGEVPVPEQHRVGDRTEEHRADERPGDRQRGRTAGVDRGRHQCDDADRRGDQVEGRGELRGVAVRAVVVAFDAGALEGAGLAALDRLPLATHPGLAPHDRHHERPRCGHRHQAASDVTHPGPAGDARRRNRDDGERDADGTQEPAVTEAHLTAPARHPQPRQHPHRPLQQHRRSVQVDHPGEARGAPSPPQYPTAPADPPDPTPRTVGISGCQTISDSGISEVGGDRGGGEGRQQGGGGGG